MSYYHHLIKAGASYGALTTAWISATGETDVTILGALNTLETDISSISSKLKAIYPFVGGSATKHKYNFIDSRDLDAAYRLSFAGGWTHGATGALPNGSNAYANTFIIPNSVLSVGNLGATFYSRTNRQLDYGIPFGCSDASNNQFLMFHRYSTNTSQIRCGITGTSGSSFTVTDSSGVFTMNRTDATNQFLYKNGVSLGSGSQSSTALSTAPIFIGAYNENNGSILFYDNEEFGFMAFHDGLTSGEVTTLYNAINAFKTTLSR